MKKLLFILSLIFPLFSDAQRDSLRNCKPDIAFNVGAGYYSTDAMGDLGLYAINLTSNVPISCSTIGISVLAGYASNNYTISYNDFDGNGNEIRRSIHESNKLYYLMPGIYKSLPIHRCSIDFHLRTGLLIFPYTDFLGNEVAKNVIFNTGIGFSMIASKHLILKGSLDIMYSKFWYQYFRYLDGYEFLITIPTITIGYRF